MPLLVFAPFLIFILILLLLFVARVAESREQKPVHFALSEAPARSAPKSFCTIYMSDAFEPETSMLWETQIDALELIYSAGRDGICTDRLRPLYMRSARLYPELYEGADFDAWLEFLVRSSLVVCTGPVVCMTPAGIAFLKSCVVADARVS